MTPRDPLMLTDVHARRVKRDAYFTEPAVVAALLAAIAAGRVPPVPRKAAEPFAGANAIAAALEDAGYDVAAADIADYSAAPSWRPTKRPQYRRDFFAAPRAEAWPRSPYWICTNPPFDEDLAEAAIRLALAKRNAVAVWFLLKNEFDTSSEKRPDLFERPDFFGKITLQWRPLWQTPKGPIVPLAEEARLRRIAKGDSAEGRPIVGRPRQHFAWFGWYPRRRFDGAPWRGARILYARRSPRGELMEKRAGRASPEAPQVRP